MKTVTVGFIGAGFAARIHAEALRSVHGADVRLSAVAGGSSERASAFARELGIPTVYESYHDLLADREIDLVSICVPNSVHAGIVIDAARAGKHIICEKPLTGAFGPSELAGVARADDELRRARDSADDIVEAVAQAGVRFFYAENWLYAPSTIKVKQLLARSKGQILDIRAEESHSGSHTTNSRRRDTAGGGSLIVLGSHPIALALHLKEFEATSFGEESPVVVSVTAEVASLEKAGAKGRVTRTPSRLVSDWTDVETWANTVLNFADGSKALITASFAMLGGVRNSFEVYTTNAVFRANMTHSSELTVFSPDPDEFDGEYLHEKIESRAGWVSVSPDEMWTRGYPQEMQDFVESVLDDREPASGLELARGVVEVVYASYLSAETGRRVELRPISRAS